MAQHMDLAVEALRPGDEGYDEAARVFFAAGEPEVVVRPRNATEVAMALDHAAHRDWPVSIRSGGHSAVGHSTNDGGLVIDLLRLDGVEVLDAARRLVRVGGGATWGQVATALDPHGWALTAGDTANVGVGGLTLGGGIGWLVRRYGLAIDNLVGARVVSADGRLLTASANEHAELFWALRGGGGNFGVVVDFDFIAQPVATVHYAAVTYRFDDLASLLSRWRDAMRAAPDELSSTVGLMPSAPGAEPTAMALLCYAGADEADADAAFEPLFGLGEVTQAVISERRYGELLEHAEPPPGRRIAVRNTLARTLDDGMIAAIARLHQSGAPMAVAVRSLGGAFGRVPAGATAFAHRDAEVAIIGMLMLPGGAADDEVERGLGPWRAVAARGMGLYVNFQGSASADDVAAAYPPATYARLAAVKRAYDPENVFARNHNITPAGELAKTA